MLALVAFAAPTPGCATGSAHSETAARDWALTAMPAPPGFELVDAYRRPYAEERGWGGALYRAPWPSAPSGSPAGPDAILGVFRRPIEQKGFDIVAATPGGHPGIAARRGSEVITVAVQSHTQEGSRQALVLMTWMDEGS